MNTSSLHPFSHRYSSDCVESICTQCFFTVARARRETDLERFEREHVCDPVMMDWFERVGPSHQIESQVTSQREMRPVLKNQGFKRVVGNQTTSG